MFDFFLLSSYLMWKNMGWSVLVLLKWVSQDHTSERKNCTCMGKSKSIIMKRNLICLVLRSHVFFIVNKYSNMTRFHHSNPSHLNELRTNLQQQTHTKNVSCYVSIHHNLQWMILKTLASVFLERFPLKCVSISTWIIYSQNTQKTSFVFVPQKF